MQSLALHYDNLLKGSFELKPLNFLFVFQVNCPGCFLYGFPIVNELFKTFEKDISFLGLSTAFEDFDKNTIDNTKFLIEEEKIIGETKKAFQQHGYDTYPFPIDFPIAMDSVLKDDDDIQKAITHICKINPNYNSFSESEKHQFEIHIKSHLSHLDNVSMTFTLNQLRGTPSFIVFDDNHKILYHKFGHIPLEEINLQLDAILKSLS